MNILGWFPFSSHYIHDLSTESDYSTLQRSLSCITLTRPRVIHFQSESPVVPWRDMWPTVSTKIALSLEMQIVMFQYNWASLCVLARSIPCRSRKMAWSSCIVRCCPWVHCHAVPRQVFGHAQAVAASTARCAIAAPSGLPAPPAAAAAAAATHSVDSCRCRCRITVSIEFPWWQYPTG
jgi:hypothetical protein